ncbi:MAG: hypothetical protein J1E38_09685 [Paramuribaculum sp.]|nr:hypothetical protein [Paramuribaculum sp.]
MAKYTSKPVTVSRPISEVYSGISNIGAYQEKLDSLPAEARAKLGDVKFTDDSIVITAPPVGEICFTVIERIEPSRVVLESAQSPVPLTLSVNLSEKDPSTTEIISEIDVEIPMFLKPMVGGKLQEAADQFGNMIKNFFA